MAHTKCLILLVCLIVLASAAPQGPVRIRRQGLFGFGQGGSIPGVGGLGSQTSVGENGFQRQSGVTGPDGQPLFQTNSGLNLGSFTG